MSTCTVVEAKAYTGRGCHGPAIRAPPKMTGKLLRCRAKSEDFGRKLLPRFTLSDDLYQPSQAVEATSNSPLSSFLGLPNEIHYMIYEALGNAPSQIALALSCKRMAMVARDLDLHLSTTSPKYAGFLPREVFDVPDLMQLLSTWMPSNLQLCDHCLTMRPQDREYWSDVDGCDVGNFWITKTGWSFANASWHKRVHNICPACHVTCSMSDYIDCDGCRVIGRFGDVDWSRVSDHWRRRTPEEIMELRGVEPSTNIWDLSA